ncbi:MAG: UPF0280 family protein [Pseudomonadota bacterium]
MTIAMHLIPGDRLHLQHGPIDLVIGADGRAGARQCAVEAATRRFDGLLEELVHELPMLRRPMTAEAPLPLGETARRMDCAVRPHCRGFVTRMAAVAGSVADTILDAMRAATPLERAYVNNGGDIALHLSPGAQFTTAMLDHDGRELGRIALDFDQGVGGLATSGRHGRSHSLGIADSVTVLAQCAAEADVAATLIANAVDLPWHPAVQREPACDLDPDSDLGERKVVTSVGRVSEADVDQALSAGLARAAELHRDNTVIAAALFLRGETRVTGSGFTRMQTSQRLLTSA